MSKERQKQIIEILLKRKQISVRELEALLFVSGSTVRRDLVELEKHNLIRRTHGGVKLDEAPNSKMKIPFFIREYEQSDAKLVIAKKAVELVRDNDVIFLDASTTSLQLIPFLASKTNILVITSGVKALLTLDEFEIPAISTGGNLLRSCLSLVGTEACRSIETFRADVCFFSCRGVSDDGYLTDISREEDFVRQTMIKNAKRAYLLCASEKFGNQYYHTICHKDDITDIISETDEPLTK